MVDTTKKARNVLILAHVINRTSVMIHKRRMSRVILVG